MITGHTGPSIGPNARLSAHLRASEKMVPLEPFRGGGAQFLGRVYSFVWHASREKTRDPHTTLSLSLSRNDLGLVAALRLLQGLKGVLVAGARGMGEDGGGKTDRTEGWGRGSNCVTF